MNEFKQLYINEGFTVIEISEHLDIDVNTICDYISEITQDEIISHKEALIKRILNFANNGLTPGAIAKKTSVSLSMIKKYLKNEN